MKGCNERTVCWAVFTQHMSNESDLRDVSFTARCYASAVLAMALCLSVCLSVCPSVRHKSVFY